jgi:predicted  nucleic acid-binding Zn-ribbon protein
LEDDFHRYKEKTLKQLTFMESENSQLKKTANEKNDRYYEEKKKSQAKIRTLEAELATLRDSSLLDSSTMRGVSSGSASASSSGASGWEDKLADLEYNITAKTNESKTLAKRCSELEEINRKQQQEILLLKARLGRNVDSISVVESASSGDGGDGESGETLLSLKRKCSELETSLRRKSRELERVEQKVKNQALMEEELSSAEAKLKRTQEALERAKAVETGYQAMQDEKKEWNVLFRDIVAGSAGSGDVAVTPAMVLRTLSATQQKCAALLKSQVGIL